MRAATIDFEIPKLRQGAYFPDWLLSPRRRTEQARMTVIADPHPARAPIQTPTSGT
jgi:transposase-like protein